jgi:hypothetical protein
MRRIATVLVVITVGLAGAAQAQESGDGTRLYKEGWSLYQQKQYAEACPLLERSLAEAPTIRTRGALALCYEGAQRWASASKTWKAVADQAKEAGAVEQSRMKRALQKVNELAPRVAQVVFQVAEPPSGVKVSLDGQVLAASDLGVPVPVDPGTHTIDAKAPDRVDWHGTFELGKSDEGKTRSLPVGPLAPIERVERVELPQGTRAENPYVPTRPLEPERRTPTLRYVAIASAGAGVVALAVGTIFALQARSKWDDAKALGCDDNGTCKTQPGVDLVNDAGSKATVGTIGFVAGAALIAGGAALWFLTPSSEEVKRTVTPSVSIGPGGAHIGVMGSF